MTPHRATTKSDMRVAFFLLLTAALLPAQDSPRLLTTLDDLARAQQRAADYPWAKAALDQILITAKAWPQSHLTKYGLKDLNFPNEGGQWTSGTSACPRRQLRFTAPPPTPAPSITNAVRLFYEQNILVPPRRPRERRPRSRPRLPLDQRPQYAARRLDPQQYAARYTTYPSTTRTTTPHGARATPKPRRIRLAHPLAWAYDSRRRRCPHPAAAPPPPPLRAAVETIQRNDAGISNWQSWHNTAIGAAGFALADEALITAAIDGKSGFRSQMKNSITPDGNWYEGAWSYHFYALDPLLKLAQIAWCNGIDLYGNLPLRAMFSSPLLMVMPNGNLPAFNDSKEVTLFNYDTLYELAWSMYMEPGFEALLGRRARGLNALLWGAPEINKAPLTGLASAVFPESGYAVLRAPEGDHMLALKFGPHGGWHGHYDKLNFVSYATGATMALDSGTQSNAARTHDTWDKVTIVHNPVTVEETTQA